MATSLALAGFTASEDNFLPILSTTAHVLLSTDVKDEWVAGAPSMLRRPSSEGFEQMSTMAAWTPTSLPASLTAWKGRTLQLVGEDGVACTSKVKEVQVVRRLSWMDGYVQLACDAAGDACDASLLEQLNTQGDKVVAALLETPCPGAVLAHTSSRPVAFPTELTEGKQFDNAVAHFRALSGFADVQKEWNAQSNPPPTEPWEGRPTVRRYALGERVFITVTADAGICSGLDRAALFGAWEVKKEDGARSWVELTPAGGIRQSVWAFVAGDGNGDGMPEFYGEGVAALRKGGRLSILSGWEWPWIGCAC